VSNYVRPWHKFVETLAPTLPVDTVYCLAFWGCQDYSSTDIRILISSHFAGEYCAL
jgi:hypothetical protein